MNVQVLSDQHLLSQYLSGDRSAISSLIDRHSRRVRDYINMMVKDRDVAEDIFQETFIKAVRVIDEGRYTDNGKFLSWVLRIAHNQVIDYFRAQRQDKTVSETDAGYDVLGTLRLSERTIEDAMVSDQIEQDVRALVELLPKLMPHIPAVAMHKRKQGQKNNIIKRSNKDDTLHNEGDDLHNTTSQVVLYHTEI